VRVTDFALDILQVAQNIFLSGGNHLKVKVGIHTGHVFSAILGDVKPQFSLVGLTVNRAKEICTLTPAMKVSVSLNTQHYLDLYTNNLLFVPMEFSKGKV
jgi:class 3 adenylate cyclase